MQREVMKLKSHTQTPIRHVKIQAIQGCVWQLTLSFSSYLAKLYQILHNINLSELGGMMKGRFAILIKIQHSEKNRTAKCTSQNNAHQFDTLTRLTTSYLAPRPTIYFMASTCPPIAAKWSGVAPTLIKI
jgi:hypothetical protein